MNATQYVVADSVSALAAGYGSYCLFKNGHAIAGALLGAVALLNVYYLSQDAQNLGSSATATTGA